MSIHVFLGPSISLAEAHTLLTGDVCWHPPAAAGDVAGVVLRDRPAAIGLIDGLFGGPPAVWHKELLFALERGVPVYGAASMGALRARELHAFGMLGVGRVFEAFLADDLQDDDEVAVAHATEEYQYRSLSVAMVTIREGLRQACLAGLIDEDECERLIAVAKDTHYADRSWERLRADALANAVSPGDVAGRLDTALAHARQPAFDVKSADARRLLRRLDEDRAIGWPRPPRIVLEQTTFWLELREQVEGGTNDADPQPEAGGEGGAVEGDVTADDLLAHLRVAEPAYETWARLALLRVLVAQESARRGIAIDDEGVKGEIRRLRLSRGLNGSEQTRRWLAEQGLSSATLVDAARQAASERALMDAHARHLGRHLLTEVKVQGRYHASVAQARTRRALLRDRGIMNPTVEEADTTEDALLRWYADRVRPICEPLPEHARRLGFRTVREFLAAMLTEYVACNLDASSGYCQQGTRA